MVLPDVSDVPLTENLVEKKREFFPTMAEFATEGAGFQQIVDDQTSTGNIFEVPENKTLFITSAWLTGAEKANVSSHGKISIFLLDSDFGEQTEILAGVVDHIAGQHGGNIANSISFPMPIRVNHPTLIRFAESGINTPEIAGGIVGFLLDKKISIR